MHVNFLPAKIWIFPSLEQGEPDFGGEAETAKLTEPRTAIRRTIDRESRLFTLLEYKLESLLRINKRVLARKSCYSPSG